MKLGVIYYFAPFHKINGTVFYTFEYYTFLKNLHPNTNYYIVGISDEDLAMLKQIFIDKYIIECPDIIPVKLIDLYKLKLDRTLILDIRTFYKCKEFLTNEIHCYSNKFHEPFRYKNDRTVTYYGSYSYQPHDCYCILKFNFDIFKPIISCASGVFVSSPNHKLIRESLDSLRTRFNKEIRLKTSANAVGNLFELVDSVHYIHTSRDANNRIIPEAFYYKKEVTIDFLFDEVDSIRLRYDDIINNGLANYTLSVNDCMIQSMLR